MTEMMPGVPAAGHLARGYWHPGKADGCPKCAPPPAPVRWCQLCQAKGVRTKAAWDVKLVLGPWADVCEQHLVTHGVTNPRLRNAINKEEK